MPKIAVLGLPSVKISAQSVQYLALTNKKEESCNYSENRGTRGRFSSAAQQRLDEYCSAGYAQDTRTRATFIENFSSIRSLLSSPQALEYFRTRIWLMYQDLANVPGSG